jgi:hypothetical protein
MDPTSIAQIAVKILRYVPFLTGGLLFTLCKTHLAPRNARAAALLGLGFGLWLVAWMARYFLEQAAPAPVYEVPATPWNILYIAAPSIAYDVVGSVGLVLAYAALRRALSTEISNDASAP